MKTFLKDRFALLLTAVLCAVIVHVFFYVSGENVFYLVMFLFSAITLFDFIRKRCKKNKSE